MPDPVTIGALAAAALSMTGEAMLKGAVGEVVKDAYKKLKDLVCSWAGADVEALEKTPTSPNRQGVIAEAINAQPPKVQEQVKALATALVAAMKDQPAGPLGLDVGKLRTLEVDLDSITVTEGTGARFGEVDSAAFRVGPIVVGTQPEKPTK